MARTKSKLEAKSSLHMDNAERELRYLWAGFETGESFEDQRALALRLSREAIQLARYLGEQEEAHLRRQSGA